jgi:hypothetical protein
MSNVDEAFKNILHAVENDKIEDMLETSIRDEGFKRLT